MLVLPRPDHELYYYERSILDNLWVESIPWQSTPKEQSPQIEIENPLYQRLELKQALRKILFSKIPFDRTALIVPFSYIDSAIVECNLLGIPLRTGEGTPGILEGARQFVAILDILEDDFSYISIKHYLQLFRSYSRVRHLAKTGIAKGLAEMLSKLYQKQAVYEEEKRSSESLEKLIITLENLRKADELKANVLQLANFIYDHFITPSKEAAVIKHMASDYSLKYPDIDFKAWSYYLRAQILRIRNEETKDSQGRLLITSETLPGVYDQIVCVGLNSENFPRRFRENPLLLDPERKQLALKLNLNLPLSSERNNQATDFLNEVLACSQKRFTGLFSAIDAINGTQKFASFSLMPLAQLAQPTGTLSNESWQQFIQQSAQPAFVKSTEECVDLTDWHRMYLLGHYNMRRQFVEYMLDEEPATQEYLDNYRDFWHTHYNQRSGIIGKNLLNLDRSFSVTSDFEIFMRCGYRWFLERYMRAKEFEEPKIIEDIDPLTKGMLLHEVFEEALTQSTDLNQVMQSTHRLVVSKLNSYVKMHKTIGPFTHKKIQAELAVCAINFISHYQSSLSQGRKVLDIEANFGFYNTESEPLELSTGTFDFKVRGRIDRIDKKNNELFVLDYKTGAAKNYQAESLAGGKKLQPPIYAEAAKSLYPQYEKIYSGYLAIKDNDQESAPLHSPTRISMMNEILNYIFESMQAGFFLQQNDCRFCQYQPVCGERVDLSITRKHNIDVSQTQDYQYLLKKYKEIQS